MRKNIFISLIVLQVIIGGLALVFIISALWHKPLGPSLGLSSASNGQESSPGSSLSAQPGDGSSTDSGQGSKSLIDKIASLLRPGDSASNSLCGGPSVMTILLIGSDERADDYLYGLADSIRIVRVDFTKPEVMVLDIPRDLWVNIPDIADHYGITHGKINQAYFFGNPGMGYYDGPGEGPGLLARTLDLNYGLLVDHYLAVDMKTFVRMIDSIGGIDIHVSNKIDLNEGQDGANPEYVYEPGTHHLDGTQALKLAMNRNPTIFQRARYQNIVLSALEDRLLSPGIIPEIPQLIGQFSKSVQTDLSPSDINQLVCIGKSINNENTDFVAFPDDMFTGGSTYDPYRQVNTYTLSVDIDLMKTYINDFMHGTWR
jgi:LCP family protein required for cell wall assembly